MKTYFPAFVLAVFCCLFGWPESVAAQERLRIHGSGGVTKALSPANFSNRYRTGLTAGAAVGYDLAKYGFEPVVSGTYSSYRLDPASVAGTDAEIDGGKRSVWSISAGTYLHVTSGSNSYRGRRHLYLTAQMGVRGLKTDEGVLRSTAGETSWDERSDTRFGMLFGLGMEFPLTSGFALKLEPAYDITYTPGQRTSSVFVHAGLIVNLQR